jgi:uncharacterized membrane protein
MEMRPSELWAAAAGIAESDWGGFLLAGLILVGMIAVLGYAGAALWRGFNRPGPAPGLPPVHYAIPFLAIAGLGVAGYLSSVEVGGVPAVCGPIGDCNAVQNSPYTRLLGIPLGMVGLAGYAVILGAWLWQQQAASASGRSSLVIFCAALFSVLFSIYLTCLELFVIRAVCIWCLTSAVLVTLILLFSIRPLLQTNLLADN